MFNGHAAGTQVNTYHNGKLEDETPAQQVEGINARTCMSDDRQNCDVEGDAPTTKIMKSSQNDRNDKLQTRLQWISCRPDRLGIGQ